LHVTDGDNAVDCREHSGSLRLGCVWLAGVASIFSVWRNGKPMSDICHSNVYRK